MIFSGAVFVYFLMSKTDSESATKTLIVNSAPRCDDGSEFKSNGFQKLFCDKSIRHEVSVPSSPHQNGTLKMNWRTLFEMASIDQPGNVYEHQSAQINNYNT